ncbi:MAG: DUF4252 domain-containing protein [Rhodothermales bacterium]|nr:DUF4252 domain-containing protein [Rhodothermales bacterium]
MRNRSSALVLVMLAALVSSGCFYSREISRARHDLERSSPGVDYGRGVSMNLGPISLRMAKWILRRVDDEDALMASEYLSEIRRVKAGIYKTRDGVTNDLSSIPSLRRFERRGWEVAVRVRDEDESVLVYYREQRDTVSDMFVVVATEDELVLAKIEGRLNRLLERAMKDHGSLFELSELSFD